MLDVDITFGPVEISISIVLVLLHGPLSTNIEYNISKIKKIFWNIFFALAANPSILWGLGLVTTLHRDSIIYSKVHKRGLPNKLESLGITHYLISNSMAYYMYQPHQFLRKFGICNIKKYFSMLKMVFGGEDEV